MKFNGTITGKDLSRAELERPVLDAISKLRPAFAWVALLLLVLMLVTFLVTAWITTLLLIFAFCIYFKLFMPWQYDRALSRQGVLGQEYVFEISENGITIHTDSGSDHQEIDWSDIQSWQEGIWQLYLNLNGHKNAVVIPKRWLGGTEVEQLRGMLARMKAQRKGTDFFN